MRPVRQNPARLAELAPENDPVGVALLIQSARQAPDEPLPLVKWRIRNSLRRRTEWTRRGLRLALVGALVFFAGSVVGAIAVPLLRSRPHPAPLEPGETHLPPQAVRHSHRRVPAPAIPAPAADESLVPAEPSALPAQPVPPESKPVAASDTSETAKVVAAPVVPVAAVARASKVAALRPSTVLERTHAPLAEPASLEPMPPVEASPPPPDEHALLKIALQRLRTAHDPVSALATLDDYRVRFPSGALAPEASMLRAEALLQIGRKGEALAELDGLSLAQMPNSDEPHVLRGELRAAVGRWREALADFDVILRGHAGERADVGAPTDAKAHGRLERALWGRALARSRLGDDAGARADLQECLRRFPRGLFAPEAARLLGEHR
jgi:CRP-like cAMP-binding protein